MLPPLTITARRSTRVSYPEKVLEEAKVKKDLLKLLDLSAEDITLILDTAPTGLKAER
jgi:hypothetical protein